MKKNLIVRSGRIASDSLVAIAAAAILVGGAGLGLAGVHEDAVKWEPDMGLSEPVKVKTVQPQYPEGARKEKVQGEVVLKLVIDTDGTVVAVEEVASPDERLTKASVRAAKQWKWKPSRDTSDNPVKVTYNITISFHLK